VVNLAVTRSFKHLSLTWISRPLETCNYFIYDWAWSSFLSNNCNV